MAFSFDGMDNKSTSKTKVPDTLSDAHQYDDPESALCDLAEASSFEAQKKAAELLAEVKDFSLDFPKVLIYNEIGAARNPILP